MNLRYLDIWFLGRLCRAEVLHEPEEFLDGHLFLPSQTFINQLIDLETQMDVQLSVMSCSEGIREMPSHVFDDDSQLQSAANQLLETYNIQNHIQTAFYERFHTPTQPSTLSEFT